MLVLSGPQPAILFGRQNDWWL